MSEPSLAHGREHREILQPHPAVARVAHVDWRELSHPHFLLHGDAIDDVFVLAPPFTLVVAPELLLHAASQPIGDVSRAAVDDRSEISLASERLRKWWRLHLRLRHLEQCLPDRL